jgi:hypothetical protein
MNSLWTLVSVIATLEMPGPYDTPIPTIIDSNNDATTATLDILSKIIPLWPTGRKRDSDSFLYSTDAGSTAVIVFASTHFLW